MVSTYLLQESTVFFRTKEEFGGLSNFAPFPLIINGVKVRTSEALYQACRFSNTPEIQETIIAATSPMTAKLVSRKYINESRPDWHDIKIDVMTWCLQVKLIQHWQDFGKLLISTGDKPIVERSSKDDFWGAKLDGDQLTGANVLGCLLTGLRDQLKTDPTSLETAKPPTVPEFLLLGQPVEVISRV